jgi:hypothetical protein
MFADSPSPVFLHRISLAAVGMQTPPYGHDFHNSQSRDAWLRF